MEARISKEVQFDAGHRVPGHRGKCRYLHGHRYRLVCTLEGEVSTKEADPDEGMVVDFGDLKSILTQVAEAFDHGCIYSKRDTAVSAFANQMPGWKWIELDVVPTAENLAAVMYEMIEKEIIQAWGEDAPFRLHSVSLWETPTSEAVVRSGLEA